MKNIMKIYLNFPYGEGLKKCGNMLKILALFHDLVQVNIT